MYLMMQYADLGSIASYEDHKFVLNPKVHESLKSRVGDDREQIIRFIFKDVMNGLLYLHDTLNLANRDIKPENILFTT